MPIQIGVNNVARNVNDMKIGINGVARNIIGAYIGINGIARQFYPSWKYATTNTRTWIKGGPSSSSSNVYYLSTVGTRVKITGDPTGDWYPVEYAGYVGYVGGPYLNL